ncbi:MAG: hypothetical protein GXP40_02280 [Chloroflexi bacterium]|nr:hypothetical protein [Chloroflexota bacterium]
MASTYASLTRDLPPVETLPVLLNPPDGLLLQPTRLYDRSGEHLLQVFAPTDAPRRYIPLSDQNPQHLPEALAQATLAMADPGFWEHPGYTLAGLDNPDYHPTLAQRLAADLLLWNEPPSTRRALRERILAAQITARYGRQQVLEWYLNSANYGHYAYGAEAAAQLYFGKSAMELDVAESADLAAVSQAPALNPIDAPIAAYQRRQETLHVMETLGMLTPKVAASALQTTPRLLPFTEPENPAPAFTHLVLAQLSELYDRARLERGGLTIITTLDFDLQAQAACAVQTQVDRLSGETAETPADCDAARLLPTLPPGPSLTGVAASALLVDPANGQVLAAVGETTQAGETAILTAHRAGSGLTPFIYLTGFTRGLSPASLLWDIPNRVDVQNLDGAYHGPLRLRLALANDYLVPAALVLDQMGSENVRRTARSFGLEFDPSADLLQDDLPLTPLDAARAYGVFAARGVMAGQRLVGESLQPVTVLRVVGADHAIWLDWGRPQTQAVVTPQLAYLMNNVLSDATARWPSLGYPNPLEIGRPAGTKLGQTADGLDAWTVGYTPQRVAVVWMGAEARLEPKAAAGLWHALLQYASRELPPEGWDAPAGVTTMAVCDPSGLLPTVDCPNVVSEVFLNGNEPTQVDNLYRSFQVNRETGYLATVFTPPELVEERRYLLVPPDAREWAESAGLSMPPDAYDAIQQPPRLPDAHISAPAMFADLRGEVQINGTASGEDFDYYRIQVGRGLNPEMWVQVGGDVYSPVVEGTLAEWDTSDLSGLYAVQLLVVRTDQRVETATLQVTVDNEPPQINVLSPPDGAQLTYDKNEPITFQVQVDDNLSLAKVEFYIDRHLLGAATESPFTWTWFPALGKRTLRVVVYDRAGNQAEDVVTFTVQR